MVERRDQPTLKQPTPVATIETGALAGLPVIIADPNLYAVEVSGDDGANTFRISTDQPTL